MLDGNFMQCNEGRIGDVLFCKGHNLGGNAGFMGLCLGNGETILVKDIVPETGVAGGIEDVVNFCLEHKQRVTAVAVAVPVCTDGEPDVAQAFACYSTDNDMNVRSLMFRPVLHEGREDWHGVEYAAIHPLFIGGAQGVSMVWALLNRAGVAEFSSDVQKNIQSEIDAWDAMIAENEQES